MRIIGVVDLLKGLAVHARAGQRSDYRPVPAVVGSSMVPGDALALAQAYLDMNVGELYVADLDAILGHGPQDALICRLAQLDVPLRLDAGVVSVEDARHALDLGACRVVVGLETLPSFDLLREVCSEIGSDRMAFSLDLNSGQPMIREASENSVVNREPPERIAARAADIGVTELIVIDLARVGTGQGLDFRLITRIRQAVPGLTLVVGGGVRDKEDLRRLTGAGCDAALVATALQAGDLVAGF